MNNPWYCNRELEPIVICRSSDNHGSFLNMASGYVIQYDDSEWKTSEHLYQAHRFLDAPNRDYVMVQSNGYLAKQIMKQLRNEGVSVSEELWDFVKVPIMEFCLNLKFTQHESLRNELTATYPIPIIELSTGGGRFWGTEYVSSKLVGKNTLGKLLMKLRYEFLDKQMKLDNAASRLPNKSDKPAT